MSFAVNEEAYRRLRTRLDELPRRVSTTDFINYMMDLEAKKPIPDFKYKTGIQDDPKHYKDKEEPKNAE